MTSSKKTIFVAGASGLVGSSIVRELSRFKNGQLLTPTSAELDLTDQTKVKRFFEKERPTSVILAAARVGGIHANNTYPADFLYENLMIETNVIHAAFRYGVEKLIFLGSSCVYPKEAIQPVPEEQLLSGHLESTNEPYAIAKIAGLKLCDSYFRQHGSNFYTLTPTNLYGPNDNFDAETSHVIPALIRKFHDAKERSVNKITIWGSGRPRREFMHVDDLAAAVVFCLKNVDAAAIHALGISHLNIGTGADMTIMETAELIKTIVGFQGQIIADESMPDGTMQKLLDVTRIRSLGWRHRTELASGLRSVYEWYLANEADDRALRKAIG